jgi:hypothetical protein
MTVPMTPARRLLRIILASSGGASLLCRIDHRKATAYPAVPT